MDALRLFHLPVTREADRDVLVGHLVAGIDLVAAGRASRVVVANLAGVEDVAGVALAHARAAHVSFALVHSASGEPHAVIGPRE